MPQWLMFSDEVGLFMPGAMGFVSSLCAHLPVVVSKVRPTLEGTRHPQLRIIESALIVARDWLTETVRK